MFTVDQIKAAHSKVKSGADFPAYIQELKSLGVSQYKVFVTDGHADYFCENGDFVTVAAKYAPIEISANLQKETFQKELLAHQQGKTDYLTFIQMCAGTGIENWEICIKQMTCTYFDKSGNVILVERIPE